MNKSQLSDLVVLNTRPKRQAAALSAAIDLAGGCSVELPCIEIMPCDNLHVIKRQLSSVAEYDYVIFLSANSVCHAMPYWPDQARPKIIAIGPGTAAALAEYAITTHWVPSHYSSQGIVDLATMQHIAGSNIMIICGENPHPRLAITLAARQAKVELVYCYKRLQPEFDQATIDRLKKHKIQVVVAASLDTLTHLNAMISQYNQIWIYERPVVVVSQKMADYARAAGWSSEILPSQPSNQALIETLTTWKNAQTR